MVGQLWEIQTVYADCDDDDDNYDDDDDDDDDDGLFDFGL